MLLWWYLVLCLIVRPVQAWVLAGHCNIWRPKEAKVDDGNGRIQKLDSSPPHFSPADIARQTDQSVPLNALLISADDGGGDEDDSKYKEFGCLPQYYTTQPLLDYKIISNNNSIQISRELSQFMICLFPSQFISKSKYITYQNGTLLSIVLRSSSVPTFLSQISSMTTS